MKLENMLRADAASQVVVATEAADTVNWEWKNKFDKDGNERARCAECGRYFHRVDVHVKRSHKMSSEQYTEKHPGAELLSAKASGKKSPKTRAKAASVVATAASTTTAAETTPSGARVYRVGRGTLIERTDLDAEDEYHVPSHDAAWMVGAREMEVWEVSACAIEDAENILISGPTGGGKTATVMQIGAVINQPVYRHQMKGETRAAEFLGEKTVEIDETTGQNHVVFKYGILAKAMKRGWWLLIDEIDMAPPEVLTVLQGVLEGGDRKRLQLVENEGEVIEAHPGFRIIATANTLGRGDESGLYAGTKVLNAAFLDRFETVIQFDYPDAETEASIIVGKSKIGKREANRMVKIAGRVREANANEECECTMSTRQLIAWARKSDKLASVQRAAIYTILNKLNSEDRGLVEGVIQRYFGSETATT